MLRSALLSLLVASSVGAQSLQVRPWQLLPTDTVDHIDVAWKGKPENLTAALVAVRFDWPGRESAKQNGKVVWTSSDTSVVTVSGTTGIAIVTARGFGSATITATATGKLTAKITACAYGPAFPDRVVILGPLTIAQFDTARYVAMTTMSVPFSPECVHWQAGQGLSVDRRGLVTGYLVGLEKVNLTAFLGVP